MGQIHIIRTGSANLASVCAAVGRMGLEPRITDEPEIVVNADRCILPGVGAFGPAMQQVRRRGIDQAIVDRVRLGRPLLAVCLGMQLLLDGSDESPGVAGLGLARGTARAFAADVHVPQMGWNYVTPHAHFTAARAGWAYFANSYRVSEPPAGWAVATSNYAGEFVAAMQLSPAIVACQCHPELSGRWGMELFRRWLDAGSSEVSTAPPSTAAVDAAGSSRSLATRIIPCLDVRDGRVVKGVRFTDLRDAGDPAERAALYESQGADELVMLDVSATPQQRRTAMQTVRRLRDAMSIPLTVGGGVRTLDDAAALLDAGADKIAINSAAVTEPSLIEQLASRFGRQCTVVAIDAKRRNRAEPAWQLVIRSGTSPLNIDAVEWARQSTARGAGEILLTSFDRDGTRCGYDVELLRAVANAVAVPVIASGGASSAAHLLEAIRAGASAVLAASIFHDGDLGVADVKQSLARWGVEVRP